MNLFAAAHDTDLLFFFKKSIFGKLFPDFAENCFKRHKFGGSFGWT